MENEFLVFATKGANPADWSFRPYEMDTTSTAVNYKRRIGRIVVPASCQLYPDGENLPDRIHPDVVLYLKDPNATAIRFTAIEAIAKWGVETDEE
ncbi:hypothetical protein [Burkholderia ubonensis]|uniref:hypothetical protein n=1 Tax=Burkholderia ubonensis TaxID=101571 RepID=UPI000757CA6A|nr:hypothetical protein [Burkholderia ubonensis]AOI70295.1 hypothetical protein WI31_12500 [Burkholderia ubonensis]KUZ13026.1 hypothetical protein WI29_26250 [Burkholderia ubonensis]KUZ34239.1 hypothetical protein WI32_19315 [Burkholderia ubonensis]KUZ37424.1 hypothetical protein WI30_05755 [Burkholderia ubonensis]KUZ37443.1 hypothetical protein WI30_05870 [Burkholderia ubonensis]